MLKTFSSLPLQRGKNVWGIIYSSDLMTHSEILCESLMSHKIPGQSCKINDLFCYLMSSSTVERLDPSDSSAPPPRSTEICCVWHQKHTVIWCFFGTLKLRSTFAQLHESLSDTAQSHNHLPLYYKLYMQVGIFCRPLYYSAVDVFHNIVPANLSGVLKPEWLVCSLNVGELRVRGERKDIKPTRGKINMRQGSGTDSIL